MYTVSYMYAKARALDGWHLEDKSCRSIVWVRGCRAKASSFAFAPQVYKH